MLAATAILLAIDAICLALLWNDHLDKRWYAKVTEARLRNLHDRSVQ
jgi:hypothetical protein